MTYLEAINAVEDAMTEARVYDKLGDHVIGIMLTPYVAEFHGAKWDQNQDDLEAGRISPGEWAERSISMVQDAGFARYIDQVKRRIADIRLDQVELDIFEEGSA